MITIGISGRIGAGKSTVAKMFAERGAHVIDADAIAHGVLEEPDAKAEIVARFGAEVLTKDGRVDRSVLAAHVFGASPAHAAALADLETVIHPRVHRHIEQALQVHAPRLIGCILDIDGGALGHLITGKERVIKIIMAEHKDGVSGVLRALVDNSTGALGS